METVQTIGKNAYQQAQELETEEQVDKVAEKLPSRYRNKLKEMSKEQLRKFEAAGAQATGMQPAQSMSQLKGFAIGLVVVGVTITVGLKIMGSVRDNINDSTAQTGASDAISGMTELSGFLPIIGLVVAAAVVIGLVSRGFGNGAGSRGRA